MDMKYDHIFMSDIEESTVRELKNMIQSKSNKLTRFLDAQTKTLSKSLEMTGSLDQEIIKNVADMNTQKVESMNREISMIIRNTATVLNSCDN